MGSLIAALGFFFLPLVEIRPNRLASGTGINLLQLDGDFRYILLFALALIPLIIAFQEDRLRRGWFLVGIGNLMMILTLLLPAQAASELLLNLEGFFAEGTQVSNPRILTASAIASGLLGGYIVMFGGLMDLRQEGIGRTTRLIFSAFGLFLIVILLANGDLGSFSIMVEYNSRGETLGQRFVEHFVFVLVSLVAGLVIGIALGLWASRDERIEPVILYVVGIIQTVPSLALFGVLLVPLARLGRMDIAEMAGLAIPAVLIGAGLVGGYLLFRNVIPASLQSISIVIVAIGLFIPVAFISIVVISFGFEVILRALTTEDLTNTFLLISALAIGLIMISVMSRRIENRERRDQVSGFILVFALALAVGLVFLILESAGRELWSEPFLETYIPFCLEIVRTAFEDFGQGLLLIFGYGLATAGVLSSILWLTQKNKLGTLYHLGLALVLPSVGILLIRGVFADVGPGVLFTTDIGADMTRLATAMHNATSGLIVRDLGVSGIGTAPAIIALTLYSLLPLVRNTYAGLKNIDPAIIDSGRGMGMTPAQIFFRIELPLAFPVIMAGVRNAGISLVGIAAVASIIGAGALGDFILLGVNTTSIDLILLGAIPAIILAVLLDALLQIFEATVTSPGIRQVSN